MTFLKRRTLSRRAALKGLGVSMGLPFLEAMQPHKASAAAVGPLRFMCVYSPNGYLMPRWTPVDTGPNWTVSPLLKPLEPYKADMTVISGLGNYTASIATMFGGSHTRGCGSLLTQSPILFSKGTDVRAGISVDQIIANTIGTQTKLPSLPVGSRAGSTTGNCEDGYSCAYNNNVSWSSPTTPLLKQVNPRDIFTRLFGDGTMSMPTMPGKPDNGPLYQKSILDVVMARADVLKKRVGTRDNAKLDEYFTSVREVEMRLDRQITMPPTMPPAAQCMPGAGPPNTPTAQIPFQQQLDLISDMVVLAFQCDTTRVVTYMYEHSFNDTRVLNFLPGVTMGHHQITHTASAGAQEEQINLFYYQRFAYMLAKLKAAKEGDASILDNSIIYMTSEFGDAHLHDHRALAVVVAGKGGGKLKTGSHVKYTLGAGPGAGVDGRGNRADTQIAALHLTTLHAFGINDATFGHDDMGPISTTTLPEIQV